LERIMGSSGPRYGSFPYGVGAAVERTAEERLTLIRRTYSLVFVGVLISALGVITAWSQPRIMEAVIAHPFLAFIVSFVPLLAAQWQARNFPANIGFMFLYTFVVGVWIAPFLAFAEHSSPGIIGQAGLLTGAAFGTLTVYAFVSRRDFSAWGGFFLVGLIVVILASLFNAFIFKSAGADLWIAGAIVLVMSGLLVFDTWRIRNRFGPDDYIPAAISIYLDLLNLFTAIIRLLLGGNRRS
jgi:FtsH-binding integral membrane protein